MRVISGKYKGRRLLSGRSDIIRPTTDRVKEFIFTVLQDFCENRYVVDLFSGSGNLGIEALSRHAAHVFFVDRSRHSLKILRNNLNRLNIERSRYSIVQSDALEFCKKADRQFDLWLLDPPFVYPPLQSLIDVIFSRKIISREGILIVEHEITNPLSPESPLYETIKTRKFGRSQISFLIRKRGENA